MADACPYRRPFPADFSDCAAFRPGEFVALDLQHRPLPSVLTCQHLVIGFGETAGSHYARCRIGDAAARAAWVLSVRQVALDALRALSAESRAAFHPEVRRLWESKGATLRDPHDQAAQRELRAAADSLLASSSAFYTANSERLAIADLTPEMTIELARRVIANFVEGRSAGSEFAITDEMLEGFPPTLRILLRPEEDRPDPQER